MAKNTRSAKDTPGTGTQLQSLAPALALVAIYKHRLSYPLDHDVNHVGASPWSGLGKVMKTLVDDLPVTRQTVTAREMQLMELYAAFCAGSIDCAGTSQLQPLQTRNGTDFSRFSFVMFNGSVPDS